MISQPSGDSHVQFGVGRRQGIKFDESPNGVDEVSENGERKRTILVNAGMLPELGFHVLLTSSRESTSVEEKSAKQLRRNERMGRSGRIAMDMGNGDPGRESVRKMRRGKKRETRNAEEMLRINGLNLFNRIVMARRDIMNRVAGQPREGGHRLNIRFATRTLCGVNHFSAVGRDVKIVKVWPNRT